MPVPGNPDVGEERNPSLKSRRVKVGSYCNDMTALPILGYIHNPFLTGDYNFIISFILFCRR